ncbi:MAG: hypothetical protein IPI96_15255 [Saprospiraceae bacterium]|nr:hypothetical protein [Saprospiraceae bacterium]
MLASISINHRMLITKQSDSYVMAVEVWSAALKNEKLGLNSQKEIPGTLMSFDESEEEEETEKI